jgi:DNA-binding PadR family transcriptional regulator
MRSLNRIGTRPASLTLSADDIVEFHAARLLLLLRICGVSGRIDGLTKLAKLDFFVRYPEFFEAARDFVDTHKPTKGSDAQQSAVESAMVRHHYGPWDKRYYHVLAHLEAKGLISVSKERNTYRIVLTDLGRDRAGALKDRPSFASLAARMREVKEVFGAKNGTYLKKLIYELFETEVGQRPLGEIIRR